MVAQFPQVSFDIRDHLDRLAPGNGKNKYVCPVCDGRNLQVDFTTGKYHCFTSDCDNKVIREAIKPWAEVLAERDGGSQRYTGDRPKSQQKVRKKQPKPVLIPAGIKLLQLAEPAWDYPEPQPISNELWKNVKSNLAVPRENLREIAYSYGKDQTVYRIEWPDESNPKGRNKTYRQSHIGTDGKRVWKKGEGFWPAYRIDEIVEALDDVGINEAVGVLGLEGEPNVELARLHGIVGLTFQGSNWTEAQVVAVVEALRATGKNVTLVVLRDNDVPGIKKAELIKSVCDHLQFPCIVIDPVVIYPDIPDKGDIKEILDNMDADEFIRRLEAEIHRQAAESARATELDDLEHDDTPDIKKISLKEAAALAQEILKANSSELAANLELEELRAIIGMNSYDWEHKIIRPIKKDLDLERYKSELLYIMAIADPVERDWRIAQIAPKYQLQRAVIERNIVQMKERTTTPESRLWSLNEVFNLQSEGLEWIIPELLPCAETVILSACPKAGKSLLAVDLAFCVATGEEKFLGQNIKMGKVLLVSVDESLNSTRSKLLKRGFRLQDNDNIKVLPQWDITQTAKLETFLEDYRPDVVIIDSLKRICKGSAVSENSAEFSDNIYALKELLTRYGAAGVLIHHSNKNADALGVDRLRGSSAIAGSVWGVWQVDHIPKKDPNNSKKLIIDPKDPKRIFSCFPRDAEGQTLDIELNLENNSWLCHGLAGEEASAAQQRETIRERILRTLEKHNRPLPGPEIIELIELTEKRASVYSELNRMVGKKVISATPAPDNKRYTLYSLPNCQADFSSVKAPPPPPPPISLPIAIYESENHIEQGFQTHSKIDSRYIAIDSSVTVESEMLSTANDCEDRVSEIDSNSPLSQGREGVKCVDVAETVTTVKPEFAQAQPIAPPEPEPEPQPIVPLIERVTVAQTGSGGIENLIASLEPETTPTPQSVPPLANQATEPDVEIGDRVVIARSDNHRYRDETGEVIDSCLGTRGEKKFLVRFDKKISNIFREILQDYFPATDVIPIARDFANRIFEAISYKSPAVASAIQNNLDEAINAGKLTFAEVVTVVGDVQFGEFKRLVARRLGDPGVTP
jgi:hypothetical protein